MPKLLRIAAYLYLAYLLLAVAVISPALTLLPERLAGAYIDRPLTLEWAWFNPFTLALEVRGLALTEKDGEPFTGLDAASVNLSLASLVAEGVVLDAARLEGFYVYVRQHSADTFNFSDLIPAGEDEAAAEEEEPAGLVPVTIGDVNLHASVLAYHDLSRDNPLHSAWHDLRVQAQDLSTVHADGRPFTIALTAPGGGTLDWSGNVSLPGAESHGQLKIEGLALHPIWEFAEPWLNFRLQEGALDLAARYEVNWSDGFVYRVADGDLKVAGIDIQPQDADTLPDTALGLGSLHIAGIAVDGTAQLATVGKIAVTELDIAGFNDADTVSLQVLFTPNMNDAATPDTAATGAAATDSAAADGAGWRAELGGVGLHQSSVRWRSPFTEPAVTAVTPIDLEVGAMTWPAAGATPVNLALTVNDTATLKVAGDLDLDTGDGAFTYDLAQLQLPWFNPALPERVTARLGSGAVAVDGSVTLAGFAPGNVALDAAVTDFALAQAAGERPVGSFDAIRLEQLAVDVPGQKVALDRFLLDGFNGRLHIARDGTVNTSYLLAPAPEAEAASGQAPADAPAQAAGAEAAESAPWQVAVREVAVRNTSVDFADESLSSEFRTDIESLEGTIVGLDSNATEPARVNLEGSVEGYAPVALTGTANPLADPPMIDLELTFDGLDMTRFTPYSGTYAGYKIDRGLLDIKLDYELVDNRLKGRNEIVINKLKLGESVASDRALDLPLKAALALLTDANGVIDLAVPVAGNLDDPKFKIGSVVLKAFTQLIIKAVTAPFSLLANLVGSDDDFQHIVFAAGSAELDEHNRQKLADLAQALTQRPRLALALAGQLHPETDRKAMQQAALDRALLEGGLAPADIEGRTPAWEAAIAREYGRLPEQQEGLAAAEQHRAVRAALPVAEEALADLAGARAIAVQSYLVTTAGMPAERVAIEPSRLQEKAPPISGVQLFVD